MKFVSEKKSIFFFMLAAIALVSVLVIFYYNVQKVKSTNDLVEHTQEVLHKSDNVLMDIINIETGLRGYLLTRNEIFLEPFYNSVTTINSNITALAVLTKDNPNQKPRIDSLKKLSDERLLLTKAVIEERKHNGLNETEIIVAVGKGKTLTDKIRSIVALINWEEFELLKERRKENENSNKISELIFLLLLVFIVIILVLVIIIIKNQKIKNKFAEELQKSSELLEKSLKEISSYKFALQESYIVAITDAKGIITFANENFCEISGYSNEELVGQDHRIINSGYHSKEFFKTLYSTIAKGKIWRGEIKNKTKNGTFYWVDSTIVPFLDKQGTPFQYVAIRIDITDRKKAEEQLITANKELEAFSYSVSHDLRAPLRAINGYSKILQEDYAEKLDDDAISSLQGILKNSKRMGELIDDLLAFSRLGRTEVKTSEINMTALVKSVREEEMLGNSNNIEFVVQELLSTKGQQVLIKQVWINLISNAIKYSRHNPKTRIEIGSYYKDNLVIYYVKDNGVGFDMQYYDKLFGVFQRLHSQEEFEGTGIGLAIVQKIIQRHKGTVWAESKLNEGSCFYFSLPNINS